MKNILVAVALIAVVVLPNIWASHRDEALMQINYGQCEQPDGEFVACIKN